MRGRWDMKLFEVGDVVNHRMGDSGCPECVEDYPETRPIRRPAILR